MTLAPVPAQPLAGGGHDPLLWLSPSPTWDLDGTIADGSGFERPLVTELEGDDFMPRFLQIVGGTDGADPSSLRDLEPQVGAGTGTAPLVLYRPLHGRYYLVVGSLVCRRIGLPDREVADEQRVTFVIRRVRDTTEQAWLPLSKQWVAVATGAGAADVLVDGEEQHSTFSVPVGALPAPASATMASYLGLDVTGHRQVHAGYIPVATAAGAPTPLADPIAALRADPLRKSADDHRVLEFRIRIAGAWADIADKQAKVDIHEPSLYLLLDLRDYLSMYLPTVLTALASGATLPAGAAENLRAKLNIDIKVNGVNRKLGLALGDLAGYMALVHGADIAKPTDTYDVSALFPNAADYTKDLVGNTAADAGLVGLALAAADAVATDPPAMPPELAGKIVPRPADAAKDGDRFVIRLVLEHEPCEPVVSKPSGILRFAGNYDPDAPARPIRIELPDPAHLRKFSRGVAIDMPPSLRRMLDRVTPKMLKEDPPNPEGQWALGMICSFSLQIIMLVAFIVMFIFLILLNIVFWWLPFLKICFPVPMKKDSP